MELEQELQRLLHGRDVPPYVADPVPAVHAGMRRRRRTQRLQVLSAALGVVVLAVGASLVIGNPLAGRQPATPATSVQPTPDAAAVPPGFRVRDLSFTSLQRGWALGAVPCSTGECAVLLATDDGGTTWSRREAPPAAQPRQDGTFDVDCGVVPCVSSIRFVRTDAGDEVGYAFNPGLAVTTDGGRTWTVDTVSGAVAALETARGNVIRLLVPQGACPGCTFTIQQAAIGGTGWTDVARPTFARGVGASLERQGPRLAVLIRGHTSGGASDARSHLMFSSDDGATWSEHDDPCGPLSLTDEVDTTQVALAANGGVVVLCRHRGQDRTFVRVSTDSGRTYGPARPVPSRYSATLLAAALGGLVVAADEPGSTAHHLLRSSDDGRTWATVASQTFPTGQSAFLDFTTDRTGTWVGPDARRLWRTSDGGQSWSDRSFR